MAIMQDIGLYQLLLCVVTWGLSAYPTLVVAYLLAFAMACKFRLRDTFDTGMTKWFTVARFGGALAGVIALTMLRYSGAVGSTADSCVAWLLAANILEAIIRDVQTANWANAVTGMFLMATIPFVSESRTALIIGWFDFPLSATWIILYSSWNAAFSYANDFAWTTRLILIPPLLVVFQLGWDFWLGARATSLLVHLTMRAVHFTPFYTPGATSMTPTVGTVHHSSATAQVWGLLNCGVAFLVAALPIISRKNE